MAHDMALRAPSGLRWSCKVWWSARFERRLWSETWAP